MNNYEAVKPISTFYFPNFGISVSQLCAFASLRLCVEFLSPSPLNFSVSDFQRFSVFAPRPPDYRPPAFPISAFASVTLNNSYSMCAPRLDSFCWNTLYCNILQQLEERPVTFVTLPQPYNFFSRTVT
jgi:hypothetical protein